MPVTESPTAEAVQNYTQVNDPGLNFHFHHNNVNLESSSFILHFIYHIIFFFKFLLLLLLFYWKK